MKKFFKELHIWLSLPLGLVMSITCFSGAMLIFEKEITEMVQKEYYFVDKVSDDTLSVAQVKELVEPMLAEGVTIKNVEVSEDAERCYKVNLSKPKRAAIFVDQYSGEVKGQPERIGFFRVMFRLHRWLMDSRPADGGIFWGKMIVGVSTLLMVIVLITGIVIWIPKNLKGLKNRLSIKVGNGWRRFWYDLHVAGGIYAVLLLLAMALTGLTWSFEWYREGFYGLFGDGMTRRLVYSIHVGNWGGMITRILWFLAAMIGAALPLTGYYLFFKRKFGKKSSM